MENKKINTASLCYLRHVFLFRSQKKTSSILAYHKCLQILWLLHPVQAQAFFKCHLYWDVKAISSGKCWLTSPSIFFSNIFRIKQPHQRLLFVISAPVEREQHLRRPESRIESYTSLCNNVTSPVYNYVLYINAVHYAYFLKANCL